MEREDELATIAAAIASCERCALCRTRTNTVPGEGNPDSGIMFIGEGPGRDEDLTGRPFVGRAGQLLDKMLASIGLDRSKVYIANIVKCRPPNNRTPEDGEQNACIGYLRAQYRVIRPKVVVCLGGTAARKLIDPSIRITRDRGQWHLKQGVWFLPTYHPSFLLRETDELHVRKREAWEDLLLLSDKLKSLSQD